MLFTIFGFLISFFSFVLACIKGSLFFIDSEEEEKKKKEDEVKQLQPVSERK